MDADRRTAELEAELAVRAKRIKRLEKPVAELLEKLYGRTGIATPHLRTPLVPQPLPASLTPDLEPLRPPDEVAGHAVDPALAGPFPPLNTDGMACRTLTREPRAAPSPSARRLGTH